MRRQPLNSIATKIILFVFTSTFVTALAVSWLSVQTTYRYLNERIEQTHPAALGHAAETGRAWLLAGAAEIETLASRADEADDLEHAHARSARFSSILRIDAEGGIQAAAGETGNVAAESLRGLARDGAAGLATIVSPDGSSLPVTAARHRGGDDRIVGIFRRSALAEVVRSGPEVDGGTLLITDADGRVVIGPAGEGPWNERRVPIDRFADGAGASREYTNQRGVHVIGSTQPFGLFGWKVALEAPFAVAYAPVLSVVTQVFVIDLCIILLFSFLAYRITSAVVRPIERLSDGARLIAQGQFDLELPQSQTNDEIGLLTRTFNDMMRRLRSNQLEMEKTNTALSQRNAELQQANEVLAQLSITDGLTKLHNHRFFQDHLTREIKRVNRTGDPLSMLLVDIDDFKSLNDRMGHAAGDELLARIARIMNSAIRETDLLARYGGEEFVVLASSTDLVGAYQLAEKTRTSIAEASFILEDSMRPTGITVSIGVAQYKGNRKNFFQDADRALYRAKAEGKNCVVVDDEEALRAALADAPKPD